MKAHIWYLSQFVNPIVRHLGYFSILAMPACHPLDPDLVCHSNKKSIKNNRLFDPSPLWMRIPQGLLNVISMVTSTISSGIECMSLMVIGKIMILVLIVVPACIVNSKCWALFWVDKHCSASFKQVYVLKMAMSFQTSSLLELMLI